MGEGAPASDPKQTPPEQSAKKGSAGKGPLTRFARGEYSLAASFWGFGALGSLIAAGVLMLLIAVTARLAFTDPQRFKVYLFILFIPVAIISLWQCLGMWRSGLRHLREGKSRLAAIGVMAWALFIAVQIIWIMIFPQRVWNELERQLAESQRQTQQMMETIQRIMESR